MTERLTDPGNLASPGIPLLRIESDGARQVVARGMKRAPPTFNRATARVS